MEANNNNVSRLFKAQLYRADRGSGLAKEENVFEINYPALTDKSTTKTILFCDGKTLSRAMSREKSDSTLD